MRSERTRAGRRAAAVEVAASVRSVPWGLIVGVGVFAVVESIVLVVTLDGPATAARWRSTTSLLEHVRDDADAEASCQALYDRLRSGRLDDAALADAARLMWSARVQGDDVAKAGGRLAISVHVEPPAVVGDAGSGDHGPQLEWRLAEVRWDCDAATALSTTPWSTPLSTFAPTAWAHVDVPAGLADGSALLRGHVEFAVRAAPGGPVVGRWTQPFSQTVEIGSEEASR